MRLLKKARRASLALVALLFGVSVAAPQALAYPIVVRPLQAAESTSSTQARCFGFNHVNDSSIPQTISRLRIALIRPVLTATPYSLYDAGSFYAFYAKESGVTTNVTTNLNLLSTNVSSGSGFDQGWGLSHGTYVFFLSPTAASCGLVIGKNVEILTDMDVANGALLDPQNHAPRFDVVVVPFSEYVEASEYLAYEDFVAGGGTLVMMAHSLEYPVTYNATTNMETLVYGHGWAFNGRYAYRIACGSKTDASCPWAKNNTDWVGSNSCLASCSHVYKYNGSTVNLGNPFGRAMSNEFGNKVFKSYALHEEDKVTNMSGTSIVSVFVNGSTPLIASYVHHFRRGMVINFGVFGDDMMPFDPSAQYFMLLGMLLGRGGQSATLISSVTSSTSSGTVLTSSMTTSASSAAVLTTRTTITSTHAQTSTSAVASSESPRALPSTLVALGGLAAVVAAAGVVVLRRRQAKPGS
jgi:hypothetical protein